MFLLLFLLPEGDPCPGPQIRRPQEEGLQSRNAACVQDQDQPVGPESLTAGPFRRCRCFGCVPSSVRGGQISPAKPAGENVCHCTGQA